MRAHVPPSRFFIIATVAVSCWALLLRCFLLPSQPITTDDFSVGLTAINYMESGNLGPVMWNHPDLCNILVYGTLKCFGSGVWGLKIWSVLFGTLSVTFVALLGRRLLVNEAAALLAATLWSLDSLSIDLSRQAVHEVYQSFFPLAAIWLALNFRHTSRFRWLVAGGLLFGAGLACKWSALFPCVATVGLLLLDIRRSDDGVGGRLTRCAAITASLLIIPAVVYLLTFAPWFGRGYSLSEWFDLQKSMYRETKLHTGYTPVVNRDHSAHAWFIYPVAWQDLNLNVAETGTDASAMTVEKNVTVLLAVSNPLVWLLVLPGLIAVIRVGFRDRNREMLFLAVLFASAYLPLVLTFSRPIFMNTALTVMPYGVMMVGYLVVTLTSATSQRKTALFAYLFTVLLLSVPLYLLAIGKGNESPLLQRYLVGRFVNNSQKVLP